jgi:membrane protease YdiL (CAAX protease family)
LELGGEATGPTDRLLRPVRWFFGQLPAVPREQDRTALIAILAVACGVMLVGELFAVRGHPVLRGAWRGMLHGALPLAVAIGLSRRIGPPSGRRAVAAGALALILPIAIRLATHKHIFRDEPVLLAVPLALGLSCLAVAARGFDSRPYGCGLGDLKWWGPRLGVCLAVLVPALVLAVVLDPALASFYPTWKPARQGGSAFVLSHLGVALDFIGWEFLFRGFLLFGLARLWGPKRAIWAQAIPFFLLHYYKPPLELISSLPGGLAAGWFCLRAGTFLPLWIIHVVQMTTVGAVAVWLR